MHLVVLPGKGDAAQDVVAAAEQLYDGLTAAGRRRCSTTTATRRPGVKFADADLLGMPVRLTLGAKGMAKGIVERRQRATGEQDELPLDGAVAALSPS